VVSTTTHCVVDRQVMLVSGAAWRRGSTVHWLVCGFPTSTRPAESVLRHAVVEGHATELSDRPLSIAFSDPGPCPRGSNHTAFPSVSTATHSRVHLHATASSSLSESPDGASRPTGPAVAVDGDALGLGWAAHADDRRVGAVPGADGVQRGRVEGMGVEERLPSDSHRRALVRRRAGEPGDPDSRANDGAQRSASAGDGVEGDLVVAVGGSALGGGLAGAPSATPASTRWATGLPGDSGAKVRVCPTPPTATHCDVVGHTA
jgi:hypothetical protein